LKKISLSSILSQEVSTFTNFKPFLTVVDSVSDQLPLRNIETVLISNMSFSKKISADEIKIYSDLAHRDITDAIVARYIAMGGDSEMKTGRIKIIQKNKDWFWVEFDVNGQKDTASISLATIDFTTPLESSVFSNRNSKELYTFQNAVSAALAETNFDTELMISANNSFGWQRSNATLGFKEIPGIGLKVNHSGQTVTAYRGMKISEAQAKKIFQEGELRLGSQESGVIEKFIDMNPRDKISWIKEQVVDRTQGIYAGQSYLIGASLDKNVAEEFGQYFFEINIPREARIPVRPSAGASGEYEKEIFVPFGIPANWIKKVTNSKTGEVLLER